MKKALFISVCLFAMMGVGMVETPLYKNNTQGADN